MLLQEKEDLTFKALGNRFRRELLDALRDNPQTTGELCARFNHVNRCTVMQHLSVLEEADLIIVNWVGRQRWNHLNALPIKHIHDRWIGDYARNAVNLLSQLKSELEATE